MNKFELAVTDMAMDTELEPSWAAYGDFLRLRGKGLPREALLAAERFAKTGRGWSYQERKRFCLWVMDRTGLVMQQIWDVRNVGAGRSFVTPSIIIDQVIMPTLVEWRMFEPPNPEPHFWLGIYGAFQQGEGYHPSIDFREAIRLDPVHVPAREGLARFLIQVVAYSQHELPSGYLGDPVDDLASLQEADALLADPVTSAVRRSLADQIAGLRQGAEMARA